MKLINKFIVVLAVCTLIISRPEKIKADSPAGFAAVAAAYVVGGAVVAGLAISNALSETETTETDEQQTTTTDSGGSESEEGSGGDDSSGENEGTDGLSGGNKKPILFVESLTKGSWFQSNSTTAIYGAAIPASSAPSGARISGATKTVPGAGVEFRSVQDKADVLQTPTKIRKVTFKRIRSNTIKITRKAPLTKSVTIPVRVKSDELRAETVDVAGSDGSSTSTFEVLVNGKSAFEISVSVSQAKMPTFSALPAGATKEERNDFGAIKNVDKIIKVRMPKGKRIALVKLVLTTQGEGRRL